MSFKIQLVSHLDLQAAQRVKISSIRHKSIIKPVLPSLEFTPFLQSVSKHINKTCVV